MRRGIVLLEALAWIVILGIVMGSVTLIIVRFHTVYYRADIALDRLDSASRFLYEFRRDLRSASNVQVAAASVAVAFADGRMRTYRFDTATGDATTDDGRAWFDFIDRIVLTDTGGMVSIDLELRRENRLSAYAPLISTRVALAGRAR